MMMLSYEQKAHIEQRFDAFCKAVMRFAARNCYRAIKRKQKHEVSLNYLMEEYNFELASMDDCFIIQPIQEMPTHFHAGSQTVTVDNERLATLYCSYRMKNGNGYCYGILWVSTIQ